MPPPGNGASTVRTLSVDGVGEFSLVRTTGRSRRFPWKRFENFEWIGHTASGAEISLDYTASTNDPEDYVLDRMRRMLAMIPEIRNQVAERTWEAAKEWADEAPASQEAFAALLKFDGANYLRDNEPSGDILQVYFTTGEEIFGDHSIQSDIDPDGRVLSARLVG